MRQTIENIKGSPIIAVIRNVEEKETLNIIEALLKGGVTNIEITYGLTSPTKLITNAIKEFKTDAVIGAGTVLTTEQVNESIAAGAKFIFSPVFDKETVEETVKQGVISIPGCISPTEIYEAYKIGASMVKVFPANILGPHFIKDIKVPMPFLDIIPTGGINKENIGEYLKAGALAVGMGSSLIPSDLIENKSYDQLTNHARELSSIAKIAAE